MTVMTFLRFKHRLREKMERALFGARLFMAGPEFWSFHGRRFLELQYCLRKLLLAEIGHYDNAAQYIANQLCNVLHRCDEITYEEPGTVEAYALLHFLDRYHRFQIIFKELYAQGIMPVKKSRIDVLDVGTGPGPSMYALSDFYTYLKLTQGMKSEINIDYVEKSQEFRRWLHIFTEHVNFSCPTKVPWAVPYHHGSFFDFESIDFNQEMVDWFSGGDIRKYIKKFRFDIIVFSNFLTTREQVKRFSVEIQDSVRYLRNKGILIVVGAKGTSSKYKEVYEELSKVVFSGNYSNWKFVANCKEVELEKPVMSYSWGDSYGRKLKELLKEVYEEIKEFVSPDMRKKLEKTLNPSYNKLIEWEVRVFRKEARRRRRRRRRT